MPTTWPAGTSRLTSCSTSAPSIAVAEGDMLERDIAANRRQRGARRVEGRLGRGVEDVAQPRDREARLVEILPDLGQPQHRPADPAGQDVEGDQLADAEVAVDDELGAEIQDRRRSPAC